MRNSSQLRNKTSEKCGKFDMLHIFHSQMNASKEENKLLFLNVVNDVSLVYM